jgi:cytochrome c551/c552
MRAGKLGARSLSRKGVIWKHSGGANSEQGCPFLVYMIKTESLMPTSTSIIGRVSTGACAMLLLVSGELWAMGMMDGGMMGQTSGNAQDSQTSVNSKRADALLVYMRDNNLPCLQCHGISGGGVGPSFAAVSLSYADRSDAVAILKDHIANGFRNMPGGLASNSQSAHLAKLILILTKTK